jgi:hypothetical protein
MGVNYSTSTTTNGLSFYLDPGNIKSYPGSGTSMNNLLSEIGTSSLSSSFTGPNMNSGRSCSSPTTGVLNTDLHSIFFMIRFNTTSSYGSNGYSGSWDKIFSFNAGGSDRTPSVWRYPGQRYLHWRYDPGNTGCDFGKNNSNNDFDIDTWYYVGVTKNNASTVQYVNGIQVGTGTVAYPKTTGTGAVTLFEYYPTDLATIGPIQIYNRPLLPNEVLQNFNAIRGRYNI